MTAGMTSPIVRINIGLMIVIALQVTSFFILLPWCPLRVLPPAVTRITCVLSNGILLSLLLKSLFLLILYCLRSKRRESTICDDWLNVTRGEDDFCRAYIQLRIRNNNNNNNVNSTTHLSRLGTYIYIYNIIHLLHSRRLYRCIELLH